MITLYTFKKNRLVEVPFDGKLPTDVIWVDMLNPTQEEEAAIEKALGIEAPTEDEMYEIEVSSLLYQDNDALYMTVTLMNKADTDSPESVSVTCMLKKHRLITLRYDSPKSIKMFVDRAKKGSAGEIADGDDVLLGLTDAIIDRISEILEKMSDEVDGISHQIFARKEREASLQDIIKSIGRYGYLNGKVRDSLLSLSRFSSFLVLSIGNKKIKDNLLEKVNTTSKDIKSLADHASFLSNKINFLLDATLGLINIEQNNIIKIFSVATAVFLPPTLIASMYGMNFHYMPELSWPLGYPFAVFLMILSAAGPYIYFKKKKWL